MMPESGMALFLILALPILGAALLSLISNYRISARLNVALSLVTLIAALSLFANRRSRTQRNRPSSPQAAIVTFALYSLP